jgi:hypothetical protein
MKTLDRYGQYFTVRATFPRAPFNAGPLDVIAIKLG